MLKISAALVKKVKEARRNNNDLDELRKIRNAIGIALSKRKYLNAAELDLIVKWKLDTQYHRSKQQRLVNTDSVVIPITQACFAVDTENFEYKVELQIKLLSTLRGIATPLASAILAIALPTEYAVIDGVLWEYIFGKEKSSFSVKDYLLFLDVIKKLSDAAKLNMQDAEYGLWLLAMHSSK